MAAKNESRRWTGGVECYSCKHKHAAAIDEELRVFARARAGGHPMPLKVFISTRLKKKYGYDVKYNTALRHFSTCLMLSTRTVTR
jgi:predicted metal-binding protein